MAFDLIATLQTFDGKHITPFQEAAQALPATTSTLAMLCDLALTEESNIEVGTTWLLKHFLEQQVPANETIASQTIMLIARVQQPESRLHLLQSLPYINIPIVAEAELHQILKQHITAKHKFVRAWSYNGLGLLARQNSHYRAEILALFAEAQKKEAASIKARIRKATKLLENV